MTDRPTVFISYSHKDEEWKDRLLPYLKALVLEGIVDLWEDSKIGTGDDWYPEIETAMEKSQAAVCLISENYLSSDFIIKEEVPYLLSKRHDDGMPFMPILISRARGRLCPGYGAFKCSQEMSSASRGLKM